ncbi:MAG: regulatory protein RecX [Clostridia bacterium]|nr:regulatory protein RecX [Clostridia bacterium]
MGMDALMRAQNAAMAMLGRRMLTCQELYDRLCRKGYDKEIAEKVIEQFLSVGYLDDRRYAELYLEDSVKLNAKGIYRIRQELLLKGISGTLIDQVLEDSKPDTADALMQYIGERNLLQGVHSWKDLEKLKARLVRRGYSLSEIRSCLEKADLTIEEEKEPLD